MAENRLSVFIMKHMYSLRNRINTFNVIFFLSCIYLKENSIELLVLLSFVFIFPMILYYANSNYYNSTEFHYFVFAYFPRNAET